MKRKQTLLNRCVLSISIGILLTSCFPKSRFDTHLVLSSKDKAPIGYTAIYEPNISGISYLTVLNPKYNKALIDTFLIDNHWHPRNFIFDCRNSNAITNWNGKFNSSYSLTYGDYITFENDELSINYGDDGEIEEINISTVLNTPALYNNLCADYWNEPLTNGKLTKSWKLMKSNEAISSLDETLLDDYMNFSAFNQKFSYKPGINRNSDFTSLISNDKKEVFATFIVSSEVIPSTLYTQFTTLANYIPRGTKAEYAIIKYEAGLKKYSLKFYKLNYSSINGTQKMLVLAIDENNKINNYYSLESISDSDYTNY